MAAAAETAERVGLLVSTRKGLWILAGDAERRAFGLDGPHFLGHVIHHAVLDPRDGRTLLAAARTGHLGPTVFRSDDRGRTWQEAARPPAFRKAREGEAGRVVDHVFWLEPGHAGEPRVWYAGTSPEGLFRSEDAGATWEPVAGLHEDPRFASQWAVPETLGTPDGPILHSIQIDPRDPRHLYVSMSGAGGGTLETTDGGASWRTLNAGHVVTYLPDPYPEYGQDPHCLRLHPRHPDVLWMQSHCGIYRMVRPSERWERVGENVPKDVGDIGFPIVLHRRDADTAWVFPMDGTDVWPRTSPGGRPAVYRTRDAGRSWERQDAGLPREQAWFTVRRQAMTGDGCEPAGVYFGTTAGEVWGSRDEGASWSCLVRHLPLVHAVEAFAA